MAPARSLIICFEIVDYDASGMVGTASFSHLDFISSALDDIAPLSGAGSSKVPEPTSILLLGTMVAGVASLLRRKLA